MEPLLNRIYQYQDEAASGNIQKGIRLIFPFVQRHFYIFHRVIPSSDISSMLKKNRLLFYQIPYSEASFSENWVNDLRNLMDEIDSENRMNGYDSPTDEPNWSYGCTSKDFDKINFINNKLPSYEYNIEFNELRFANRLLTSSIIPGNTTFDNLQSGYQCKEMIPFLLGSVPYEKYENYKKSLLSLECILYENINKINTSIRQLPLYHLGVWIGVLIIIVDKETIRETYSNINDFDIEISLALPWIAQKMYRFVIEKRFETKLFNNVDAWVIDQISRIGATSGLGLIEYNASSKSITLKNGSSPHSIIEHIEKIRLSNGLWRINFKFQSDRNNSFAKHALSEMKEAINVMYERFDSSKKSARAAIMSRNMSHNLGSHALANSKFFSSVGLLHETENRKIVTKEEFAEARGRLQAFNHYMQGRLDFIARVLSEGQDQTEPLFLAGDVLKGFMTQQVLLETLLDDNGFRCIHIKMHLHKEEQHDFCEYKLKPEKPEELDFVPFQSAICKNDEANTSIEDVLVGITGGITGCHAFYALMENLLRNAAKYSRREFGDGNDRRLNFHIEFLDSRINGEECYQLRLWENLTNDLDNSITSKVREGLSKGVVNEDGRPQQGGHGIQEMKLCAEYLAAVSFPDDSELLANGQPTKGSVDQAYIQYIQQSQSKIANGIEFVPLTNPKLRAYCTEKNGRQALVYEMVLPKPVLLGLTCVRCKDCGNDTNTSGDHPCNSLDHPCVKRCLKIWIK